jgi:four helix bundle protein
MERSNFENLEVYRLAEEISDSVWSVVETWHVFARDTVGQQLVEASDSIGANIAEGAGRGTYRDNCKFIHYARGSLYETKHWLRRAYRRKLLSQEQIDTLKPMLAELAPRLNAYLRSIRRNRAPRPHTPPLGDKFIAKEGDLERLA